jgi:hypothetical protein
MMNRIKELEIWLTNIESVRLAQLQETSGLTASSDLAVWIVREEWLPEQYDLSFPYPQISLGANHPDVLVPESFKALDVSLPPMLLEMAGVKGDSRFVSLYYMGSKATWSDGRSMATFPYYTVWEPYIDHIAMAIDLFDCNLGSDDYLPTHALVCDRSEQKVYVADYESAQKFLDRQHPPRKPITQEEWDAIKAQVLGTPQLELEQLQQLGLFESWLRPTTEQIALKMELIGWLDRCIDEALINKYVQSAKNGSGRAIWHLENFYRRIKVTEEKN